MPLSRLCAVLEIDESAVEYAVKKLEEHYNDGERGIRVVRLEDSFQLCSAPEYAEVIRRTMEKRRAPQLSPTALEVLAIVAYFQPVTRAYIESVRGVDSSYTVASLQSRGLIEQCGNLQVPGRPALFQTTKAFLRSFSLNSLEGLPPLPEVESDSEGRAQIQSAIDALRREAEEAEQMKNADPEDLEGTLFALGGATEGEAEEDENGDEDKDAAAPEAPEDDTGEV